MEKSKVKEEGCLKKVGEVKIVKKELRIVHKLH